MRQTRSAKNVQTEEWVDASLFPFEMADTKKRSNRRTTIEPNPAISLGNKRKRKSCILKRLELPENQILSPTQVRKTRRQSMATLINNNPSKLPRAISATAKSRHSKSDLLKKTNTIKEDVPKKVTKHSKPPVLKKVSERSAVTTQKRRSMGKLELCKMPAPQNSTKSFQKEVPSFKKKSAVSIKSPILGTPRGRKRKISMSPRTPTSQSSDTDFHKLESKKRTKFNSPHQESQRKLLLHATRDTDVVKKSWRIKRDMIEQDTPKSPILPSTPVNSSNLPPTPKSANCRSIRHQNSLKRRSYLNVTPREEVASSSTPRKVLQDPLHLEDLSDEEEADLSGVTSINPASEQESESKKGLCSMM